MAPSLASLRDTVDLRHLRQIVAGLDEGVILIDPDQSLLWANDAALTMHGVERLEQLGRTVDEYRADSSCVTATTIGWRPMTIRSSGSRRASAFPRSWSR